MPLNLGHFRNDGINIFTSNDSLNKLHEGKGNLIRRAEKIKELGAKTNKDISRAMLEKSEEGDF